MISARFILLFKIPHTLNAAYDCALFSVRLLIIDLNMLRWMWPFFRCECANYRNGLTFPGKKLPKFPTFFSHHALWVCGPWLPYQSQCLPMQRMLINIPFHSSHSKKTQYSYLLLGLLNKKHDWLIDWWITIDVTSLRGSCTLSILSMLVKWNWADI